MVKPGGALASLHFVVFIVTEITEMNELCLCTVNFYSERPGLCDA